MSCTSNFPGKCTNTNSRHSNPKHKAYVILWTCEPLSEQEMQIAAVVRAQIRIPCICMIPCCCRTPSSIHRLGRRTNSFSTRTYARGNDRVYHGSYIPTTNKVIQSWSCWIGRSHYLQNDPKAGCRILIYSNLNMQPAVTPTMSWRPIEERRLVQDLN